MNPVENAVHNFVSTIGDKHVVVAYSGGVDSQALLFALYKKLGKDRITAVHINHGNTDYDDDWEDFCNTFCNAYDINLEVFQLELGIGHSNFEAVSRDYRYTALKTTAESLDNAVVVTGHHMDDQAETIILRLMRGAGVDGLAGIPVERALGKAKVVRPFLSVPKSELIKYCECQGISWYHDVTNLSTEHDRNFIRLNILPVLSSRWPSAVDAICQTAEHCSVAAKRLKNNTKELYTKCDSGAGTLLLDPFKNELTRAEQCDVVRMFFTKCGLNYPNKRILRVIIDEVIHSDLSRTNASLQTARFKCKRTKIGGKYQLVLQVY